MDLLALTLSLILAILAGVHFFWAAGGLWPLKSELSLARTVDGATGINKMPNRGITVIVGLIIAGAAIWPLMWRALIPYLIPQGMVWAGMFGLTLAFLIRGLSGFLPFMNKRHGEQPFARLNKQIYSPLCLALGAGFALLLLYL